MKRPFLSLCTLLLLCPGGFLFSQRRPLVTETTETVAPGHLLGEVGAEFLQDAVFRVSGLKGDLSRLGVLGVAIGVGKRAEVQMQGTLQNFLNVEQRFPAPRSNQLDFAGNSTSDFGDLTVATKVRMFDASGPWPALAFHFGVTLPNAQNESGLGTDETDAFSSLLLEKRFGQLRVLTNLGLAILGDPVDAGAQDDLFTYGLAAIYPLQPNFNVVGEWQGRAGSGGVGTEEQSLVRLGGQLRASGVMWDFGVFVGLRETDPASGWVVGISKDFHLPFLD